MTGLVVIPARWGSTRLPGKPLVAIAGRTLLSRAIDLGRRATKNMVDVMLVVATDDERIARHAQEHCCPAVMTSSTITSGSGRTLAAAHTLPSRPQWVCNLQGDAPFMPIDALARALKRMTSGGDAECVTPVVRLSWPALDALRASKQTSPGSGTTCVRQADGRALWFSKQILPFMRDEAAARKSSNLSPVWRHIGLYCYTLTALERFESSPPSVYEQLEGLEQLRLLDLGIRIDTVITREPPIPIGGIDDLEDVRRAEALIAALGDPFGT